MRRSEFKVEDTESIDSLLSECEYGTLSLIHEGKPYGVAVNYVYFNERFFIHGAKEGRKVEAIKSLPFASFSVVKPFSIIPSYFSRTLAACPATQFFASVVAEGSIKEIQLPEAKSIVLNKMMQKLQKEGGYEEIDYSKPMYTKMIDSTAIFELHPTVLSCKLKVGQNLSQEKKEDIMAQLQERANSTDTLTVEMMKLGLN